jgi:hypothetical protein
MEDKDFVNLASELSVATEKKEIGNSMSSGFGEEQPAPAPTQQPAAAAPGADPDPLKFNLPKPDQTLKVTDVADANIAGEMIVDMIDAAQSTLFRGIDIFRTRRKFNDHKSDLEAIAHKADENKTPQEKGIESWFKKEFAKLREREYDFNEDLRKKMIKQASKLAAQKGMDIPPGMALALLTLKGLGDSFIEFSLDD